MHLVLNQAWDPKWTDAKSERWPSEQPLGYESSIPPRTQCQTEMSLLQRFMGLLAVRTGKPLARLAWVVAASPTLLGSYGRQDSCPLGLGLLPADAHVYPGWARGTWLLSLVLRNLDSCPWTVTKTLPSRRRRNAEHVAVA
jgi:hypothetical protein